MSDTNYIKVKDKDYLLRDSYSNGIVNSDIESYNCYVQSYKKAYNESQKIKKMENEMNNIKNELGEIKNLLQVLINGSK